jgi:hypothetical protein
MADRSILRASDADREQTAERLRRASTEGRITADELEDRIHGALSARTYGELDVLVDDLPSHRPRVAHPAPTSSKTSGLAVASLVMGFLWMGGMGSLVALILGLLAKSEINRSRGMISGRGLAMGGIILGSIGLLAAAAMLAVSMALHVGHTLH